MKKLIMVALITLVGASAMAEEYKYEYECKGSYIKCKKDSEIYAKYVDGGVITIGKKFKKGEKVAKDEVGLLIIVGEMSSGIEEHILKSHANEMSEEERITHMYNKTFADGVVDLKSSF